MPRKITFALVLLKNTFAKEYIIQILLKQGIRLLPTPPNTKQAEILLDLHKPELFICDDSIDTIEIIIEKLKAKSAYPKTILFTDSSKIQDIVEYYALGVLGIIRIDAPVVELSEAIKSVLDNFVYICSAYKKTIKPEHISSTHIYHKLSNREQEIMQCIGYGLTNNQIGEKLRISPYSVNNHRAKIRKKLNLKGGKSSLIQVANNSESYT